MKPRYILLRGPAGSGKSTLATNLIKHYKKKKIICVHKLPGTIRKKLKLGFSLKEKVRADNIILKEIKKFIRNDRIIILDEVFYYPEQIRNFEKKLGRPIAIIHVVASLKTCMKRNKKRAGKKRLKEDAVREVHALDRRYKKGTVIRTDRLTEEEVLKRALEKLE